jgi:hypothetical protein
MRVLWLGEDHDAVSMSGKGRMRGLSGLLGLSWEGYGYNNYDLIGKKEKCDSVAANAG